MSYPIVKPCLDTSENDIVESLFTPCLSWATRYDRAVGFFTSGWLEANIVGMSSFISQNGHMRLITSPIISNADLDAIINSQDEKSAYAKFEAAVLVNVENLATEMKKDLLNAFSWMIFDGIIELKFAIPYKKLDDGLFHTKFGIFYNGDDAISFSGSLNDSMHGLKNFEDIKVFSTWSGNELYVSADIRRFERIWKGEDSNLKIFNISQAIKNKIFTLRTDERPYSQPQQAHDKWIHQDLAVEKFIEKEHGILAMATGTGKTVTAMKIIRKLFNDNLIKRVIITMYGNDLMDQWAKQIRENFSDKAIYYQYGSEKKMTGFVLHPDNAILLISRDAEYLTKLLDALDKMPGTYKQDTLFIFDEVHGAGSNSFVKHLAGRISPYRYRLGLSATPEREYDEDGNEFIAQEIGEVIFEFTIKDAIEKNILCEFDYVPLPYALTEEEKRKKRNIIAYYSGKRERGETFNLNEEYTQLAAVNKSAIDKIVQFKKYITEHLELLNNCIIFVYSKEYGERLQEVLINYCPQYHTYYADDEKIHLENFASGITNCLLTCKKISEGIDISSVSHIFLFASDRSRLVTTQRIGRALRIDRNNPNKRAVVVDFIIESQADDDLSADGQRMAWLEELAQIRRKTNEN